MLKAFLVGSLVYLIAAGALAQSQRQPQQRPPSNQNTQQAVPDQRGTDQIPFTVKILPAETAKKEAEKAEAEKAEKAAIDKRLAFDTQRLADYTWWLANYTWWLAAFTALLFSVAILQVAMFFWQLILIKRSAHDATVAANAAMSSAQVARDEFIATHRPKLRAFAFQLGDWDPPHDVPISVLFQAQNIGETTAHVFRVQGRIFIAPRNNMPLEPGMDMAFSCDYDVNLRSGERDLFGIDDGPALTEMTATAAYAGQTPIICVGRISYRDDNGIERQTGFARKFVIRPHRSSERIADPDYEHEY